MVDDGNEYKWGRQFVRTSEIENLFLPLGIENLFIGLQMGDSNAVDVVEEATLAFSMGDDEQAATMLQDLIREEPNCFEAWHALAEVLFSARDLDGALGAGEEAVRLRPDDLHANVSLSRIWAERGDKAKAEDCGAKARVLGWKAELAETEDDATLG